MNDQPADSANNLDLTGQTIGDYYLIRRLGRGGMADVYLALQRSLKRNVAIKILKPELAEDESYVKRFRLEAQAAAALVQANIVQVYEVNEAKGLHFIAQEYVPGRNLKQYINRFGAVEPLMAVNVLRQVGLALQKSDEKNVIHRDIKPENIMISTKGEVKVADFGLARISGERSKQDLTQIGITMGTPLYMSPEQVAGHNVDSRTDIYSLGVTAYHMLAGRPPYEGENALAIALQHVNKEPEPLRDIRPDVPDELCTLIHQMMAKKLEDRPTDANELLKELRKVKIDVEEDWEQLVEKLAMTDGHSVSTAETMLDTKLAVTQQLETVMKGNTQSWWTSPVTILTFCTLIALGAGIGIGRAMQNPPVIPKVAASLVPKEDSVRQQYRKAFFGQESVNKEEAWQAVINYFPIDDAADKNNTQYFHHRALERLGELYIERAENASLDAQNPNNAKAEWNRALGIYEGFSNIHDVNNEFNLIGWAGKAIVYHNLIRIGHADESINELSVKQALLEVEGEVNGNFFNDFIKDRIKKLMTHYQEKSSYHVSITSVASRHRPMPN